MTRSDPTRQEIGPDPLQAGHHRGELHLVQPSESELIAELRASVAERERAYQDLAGALASARRIGAAIGVVMSVMKVTEDDAFAVLARISQKQNRKLRLVADDIVLTGTF